MSGGVLDDEGYASSFAKSSWKLTMGSLVVIEGGNVVHCIRFKPIFVQGRLILKFLQRARIVASLAACASSKAEC